MVSTLTDQGIEVVQERITPTPQLRFPVASIPACLKMMVTTFVRKRVPIEPLSAGVKQHFDLLILAGPTWSYNPSGPILSLIDRDGPHLFQGQTIIPLISCRGYWRLHRFGLKRLLRSCGASVPNQIIFSHPNKEPWRTVGVFLKIAGKNPERQPLIGRYYQKFGHSKLQQEEAGHFATLIANALKTGIPLESLNFHTPHALP